MVSPDSSGSSFASGADQVSASAGGDGRARLRRPAAISAQPRRGVRIHRCACALEHLGNTRGQPLRVVQVQELVRAVRVRVRPEHPGDQELRLRELRAEHRHERDRAAFAHPHRRLAVVRRSSRVDALLEPRRVLRRVPAGAGLAVLEAHVRAVRRIFSRISFSRRAARSAVDRRRQAQREHELRRGRSTLPALAGAGRPSAPVTASIGRQVRFRTSSARSACIGCMPRGERELAPDLVAQHLRRRASPARSRSCGNRAWKAASLDHAGARVLDAVEQHARDAEARGHHAARVARVHALGQHLDREHAVHQPAQRGRAPELVVVAAAGVEADDEVGRADPSAQSLRDRPAGRSCRSPRSTR